MNCFYHQDVAAVALCKNCSRGLCPGCSSDLPNGTACRDRCESQVIAVNEMIERGKSAYQKTSGAYSRTAIVYLLMGAVMALVGALSLPTGGVFLAVGVVLLIAAAFNFSTARKMRSVKP